MNISQAIKMAFRSILGNKGRSALTMLGIIIGIASVMTIVSVVGGMNQKSLEYYEAMGVNKINVSASYYSGGDVFEKLYPYCNSLGSEMVLGVTPSTSFSADVRYGAKSSFAMQSNQENMWDEDGNMKTGVDLPPDLFLGSDQYAVCNNFRLGLGRDLNNIDIKNYNRVCVLGARTARTFFNYANPVGQTMLVNGLPFEVVGVYQEKDPDSPWSMDNIIVFPYTLGRLVAPGTAMTEFVVKASSSQATTEATSRISGFLAGIIGEGSGSYSVYSENEYQESSNEYANMLSLVLGGIAAISLLVGGIGIMNIMLVTVTERTREIGIRRAIGAERRSIVIQFLIEAAMICAIGGVIGILIGAGGAMVAGKLLLQMLILPPVKITIGAVVLSVALGILFGIYPAAKAAKLQPVEALRAE